RFAVVRHDLRLHLDVRPQRLAQRPEFEQRQARAGDDQRDDDADSPQTSRATRVPGGEASGGAHGLLAVCTTLRATRRSLELITRWLRRAASRLTSNWTRSICDDSSMAAPSSSAPSASETTSTGAPVTLRTISRNRGCSAAGTNSRWQRRRSS